MSNNLIRNLLENLRISEDLGGLADLKAGDLMNVFKQGVRNTRYDTPAATPDEPSFKPKFGSKLGQNSSLEDIGQVKSWKDIRKKVKLGEGIYNGFILYADGQAFGAVNLASSELRSINDTVIVAFDPSKLPMDKLNASDPYTVGSYHSRANASDRLKTKSEVTRYDYKKAEDIKTGRFKTGQGIRVRELPSYIDDVAGWLASAGLTMTATLIGNDEEAVEKAKDRRANRTTDDELARRQDDASSEYASDRNRSLNKALGAHKASKNHNTFTSEEEVSNFLSDSQNFGESFVYNNRQYDFKIDKYSNTAKVDVDKLIRGEPITIRVSLSASNKQDYNSLPVTYSIGHGGATVTKVGY